MILYSHIKKWRLFLIAAFLAAFFVAFLVGQNWYYKNNEFSSTKFEKIFAPFLKAQTINSQGIHKFEPQSIKGIYVTGYTASNRKRLHELMDLIDRTELNAMILDIKDYSGRIFYDADLPLADEVGSKYILIKDIGALVQEAHQRGIYVIARIAVFQDPYLVEHKPELAVKSKSGGIWRDRKGLSWVDPASEVVWHYNVDLARDAISRGFDEINFDYVRFPSDGNLDDLVYTIWDNKTPKNIVIRNFFSFLNQELKPEGKPLSVDLFGMTFVNEDDLGVGQHLEDIAPYFDYLSPMVYPSHYPKDYGNFANPAKYPYEVISGTLHTGKSRLEAASSTAIVRPWLQDFDLGARYDASMVQKEIKAVYDNGAYGWMLWNAANIYTESALEHK